MGCRRSLLSWRDYLLSVFEQPSVQCSSILAARNRENKMATSTRSCPIFTWRRSTPIPTAT